jgi:TPR repeat protein/class 3 adenylate cyclase
MAQDHQQRLLATILAADVFGYSRLMAEDEEYTLRTLKAYRVIVDRLINGHEGRIFHTAGDSVLAQFQSAVEAVRCAIAIQQELRVRNAQLHEARRMEFRIGIHVGDVLVEGDNLYGDGVNIAARLEGLARPGELCISGSVLMLVKNKLSYAFEDMGPQTLKNIPEPVPAFRLTQTAAEDKKSQKRFVVATAVAMLALLIVGIAGWMVRGDSSERAWAAVQNTTDRAALEDFIQHFGNSRYAEPARSRLSSLSATASPPADEAERAWAATQNTTDPSALEDFVRRYGNTSYGNAARERLSKLTANKLSPEDPAERAWTAAQNTADPSALEDFVRRYGNTSYGNLARERLSKLNANKLSPDDAAERAWAAVQNTTDPAALDDFVSRYGNTGYGNLARERLSKLKANPLPNDPAERAWAAVQNTNDRAALEDFIGRHGNSRYGNAARERLSKLNANPLPPDDPAARAWAAVQNTKDRGALEDFIRRHGNSAYGILARARLAELTGGIREQDVASVRQCDGLAANPDDTGRGSGIAGVRWELLDPNQAVPACRAAAAARPDDARLMYQLGRVLEKQGAFPDALSWYRKAADRGYVEAMNNLGIMFTNGRGVARDDTQALGLFRKASDGGSTDAITNLGFMYHYGRGVAPNMEEAVRLFRKAADAGSAEGMYWLGQMYETGAGVNKDETEAFKWYRKAADVGVATAMNKVGVMYANGSGVGKDMTEAVRWYRAAAAAGNLDAKANLARLGN